MVTDEGFIEGSLAANNMFFFDGFYFFLEAFGPQ
jgi:hypothetical protein